MNRNGGPKWIQIQSKYLGSIFIMDGEVINVGGLILDNFSFNSPYGANEQISAKDLKIVKSRQFAKEMAKIDGVKIPETWSEMAKCLGISVPAAKRFIPDWKPIDNKEVFEEFKQSFFLLVRGLAKSLSNS